MVLIHGRHDLKRNALNPNGISRDIGRHTHARSMGKRIGGAPAGSDPWTVAILQHAGARHSNRSASNQEERGTAEGN